MGKEVYITPSENCVFARWVCARRKYVILGWCCNGLAISWFWEYGCGSCFGASPWRRDGHAFAPQWLLVCGVSVMRLRFCRLPFTPQGWRLGPLAVWLKGHRPQEIQVRCFYLPNLGDACFLSVFFTESCRERFAWGNAQGQISGHAKSEIRLLAASFACLAL